MKVSIQRQCDGFYADIPGPRCDSRMEVAFEVADRVEERVFVGAWESAAAALGWRRLHGPGATELLGTVGMSPEFVVPSTKAWVACPGCVKNMKLVCARCPADAHECSCMGGPNFDARLP